MANADHKYKYEAVTGYFLQDNPKTDPDTFEYASHSSLTYNKVLQSNNITDKKQLRPDPSLISRSLTR
jgi:hypothetical protein